MSPMIELGRVQRPYRREYGNLLTARRTTQRRTLRGSYRHVLNDKVIPFDEPVLLSAYRSRKSANESA